MTGQTTWHHSLFRAGGRAAIVGALLGLVANLLHPITPTDDPEGVARVVADSELWVPVHLAIIVGLVLMLGGLVAIYHSIGHSVGGGVAGVLGRFGLVAAVAGTTVGLVLIALDGLAAKQLAEAWATAPAEEKATAVRLVQAQETTNFALLSLFNILFAGVTFVLYGLAVAASRVYPRWLGLVVVAAGVGGLAAGSIQANVGQSTPVTAAMGIIAPTVITLWLVVMGTLLLRSTARPADATASVAASKGARA
jgi:Domain of unknown function (DUF4386)